MRKATERPEQYVTLKHAAEILGRKRDEIDLLVRREKLVMPIGKRGKGGQLCVETRELPTLEAAAELFELKVPTKSIRDVFQQIGQDAHSVTVVYRKGAVEILHDPTPETLSHIASAGATVKTMNFASMRESINDRIEKIAAPARRGRPKLDREFMRERLKATMELGEEDASADSIAELIGPRGTLPPA